MKRYLALGVLVAAVAVFPATASARNPHEVPNNEITCTLVAGPAVSCSGSIAGLGTGDVIIQIDANLACETRPRSNQPGGHLQGTSEPITPRGGRVNFENVTTDVASCPAGLNPVVGDTATINVFDAETGALLFTTTVAITS